MDNLIWFQEWYANQSIENIGKNIDIRIKTAEGASWNIEIDLHNTKHKNLVQQKITVFKSKYNWFEYEITDKIFSGKGDFNKLGFLLGKFRELIGEFLKPNLHTDKFLDSDIQDFLLENEKECYVFVHYAIDEEIAHDIIDGGFQFASPFDRATKEIKNEEEYLKFTHYVLKSFGDWVVVICIDREIYDSYIDKIKDTKLLHTNVEELFSETPVFINENSEEVYTLHKNYIKGFFNFKTKEFVENPDFNPKYDSPEFVKNIERYK